MSFIDLHVHSTMSDGSFSPEELVHYACEKGLSAFALTDHDTVAGIGAALKEASSYPIQVIPGVEMTSVLGKQTVHILGYYVSWENEEFINILRAISRYQDERNIKICSQLRTYGIDIEYEEFRFWAGCRTITRDHFAAYLISRGYVTDRMEAYKKYLGKGQPCFIPQYKIPVQDAVRLILSAGGLPVIAHPGKYRLQDSDYIRLFSILKGMGVKGVEAIYSEHTREEEALFSNLAKQLGLFITGGSDFHGKLKPDIDLGTGCGNLMIPDELLNNLRY